MKRGRVFMIASLILVLVLCTGVGTLAYFTDQKNVTNDAKFGKLDVKTKEKVVKKGKEDVGFTVESDSVKCWVRLFVGIPKASGNQIITIDPEDPTVNSKWKKDGEYYYYKEPVNPGESKILFKSIKCTSDLDKDQQYSNFDIIVYAEAIQYDNTVDDPVEAFKLLK
ncbi:hypothetical protein lbkm_0176 [Lachnospiraceae bacterium KM106-2]|nr:hypothetical protein lbkm_0176 [Lachnospiraceae bacterium KM106-2]